MFSASSLSQRKALSSADMYLLLISGIIVLLLGLAVIAAGIRQGTSRISAEERYEEAEGSIIAMKSRLTVHTVNFIPLISKEYSAAVEFMASDGRIFTVAMPYVLKASAEYRDERAAYENGTPVAVKYDPADPQVCYIGDNRGFRIREIIYKVIAAVPLLLIGYGLIWWHFHI